MGIVDLICIIVPLVLTVVSYISTSSLLISIFVFALSMLYFLFRFRNRASKSLLKKERFSEQNSFINNFIISLSIKKSIGASLEGISLNLSDGFKSLYSSLNELDDFEKLSYMKKYFYFDSFSIFLDILNLWINQGGEVLNLFSGLSEEIREQTDYVNFLDSAFKKNLLEFIILWSISLMVLVVLRFALSNFYTSISSNLVFLIGISIFMILVIISIDFVLSKWSKVDLKGWDNNVK